MQAKDLQWNSTFAKISDTNIVYVVQEYVVDTDTRETKKVIARPMIQRLQSGRLVILRQDEIVEIPADETVKQIVIQLEVFVQN